MTSGWVRPNLSEPLCHYTPMCNLGKALLDKLPTHVSIYMPVIFLAASIMRQSREVQSLSGVLSRWMDKEAVVQSLYNEILLSHKKDTFELLLVRWMNLEPVKQSEVRKRKILNSNVYIYIYMECRKMVLMNLFAGQQWRYRCREQTSGHSWGRRGREELRKWHWNIYVSRCKIDTQWEFAIWCRDLTWCSVTT